MLPGCIYVALHFFLTSLMKVNLYAFLKRINMYKKTFFQPNMAYREVENQRNPIKDKYVKDTACPGA